MKKLDSYNVDLILKNTDALSGTPKILIRQANSLILDGARVSVIAENFHPSLKRPEIACKKTIKWPKAVLFQRRFFDWQARRKTRKDAIVIGHGDSLHQDILFLHTCVHLGAEVAPGPHNAKNLSIPFHRMMFEQGSYKEIVCVTHMMKEDIKKRFNLKVPIHVIHPCHDKEIVNQVEPNKVQAIRDELKVAAGEIVVAVICSGDLDNRGAFATIAAFAHLDDSIKKKVRILIVGKEKKPARVYQAAQNVGMGDRILWSNVRPDVANLIAAADIVVHAANIEASGLTFLEFMALSRPVITTKTVGFSEILPEIQRDFIIEKQDAFLISEKLKILLANPELASQMGEANRRVASLMTWDKYDEQFMDIIHNHIKTYRKP